MSLGYEYSEYGPMPEDPEIGDRFQMENAAFWKVYGEYGWYTEPIDDHAVYGYPRLGDRDPDAIDVSIRTASIDLKTAIRCLGGSRESGIRVRPADNSWYVSVEPHGHKSADEGFLLKKEGDDTICYLEPYGGPRNNRNIFNIPWLREFETGKSRGGVECLEVIWDG